MLCFMAKANDRALIGGRAGGWMGGWAKKWCCDVGDGCYPSTHVAFYYLYVASDLQTEI